MDSLCAKLTRRKIIDESETTELKRVLSTLDLTLLGIGSTLGIGIYVLAGAVAKNDAGPAVTLSFLFAALASVLAGLCYAEFGARVPKAGSAYVYSYVSVGELTAFIVGWNLIMEYVIGVASVAKGYSGYVDSLFHGTLKSTMTTYLPINSSFLSHYFDVFAFAITLTITFVLAFGVKESSLFNNIFTGLNLVVVTFVIIAGSIFARPTNWVIDATSVNSTALALQYPGKKIGKLGSGGFAPFGFAGIMKGAATCFYGFVGFDCIATTGEEAKNPQKSIPLAIIFSLLFVFLAYFGISTVITMMVPYYLQDSDAPLPEAFMFVDFGVGKWIVSIGALFGLSTSLLGAMFPMPRVIYAMANDGLLFKFLGKVHPKSQTPLAATILAGSFGAIMAAIFDLEALIDMMSIGTLTAYSLVAICVLILRYRKEEDGSDEQSSFSGRQTSISWRSYLNQAFNKNTSLFPTELSSSYSGWVVLFYCACAISFCAVAIFADEKLVDLNVGYLFLIIVIGFWLVCSLLSLAFQPVSKKKLSFKVPLVPLVPGFSILANIYLIMKLTSPTWIRFAVWLFIGMIIYLYCLLSGLADRAYKASMKEIDESKRKYSKISVSGINSSSILSPDLKTNGSPKKLSSNEVRFITSQNSISPLFKAPMETIEETTSKNFNSENKEIDHVKSENLQIDSFKNINGVNTTEQNENKAADEVVDSQIQKSQEQAPDNEFRNRLK